MVLWNREMNYEQNVYEYPQGFATCGTHKKIDSVFGFILFLVPSIITIYLAIRLNSFCSFIGSLLVCALAWIMLLVITFLIVWFIELLIYRVIPYLKTKTLNLNQTQKRLEKAKNKRNELKNILNVLSAKEKCYQCCERDGFSPSNIKCADCACSSFSAQILPKSTEKYDTDVINKDINILNRFIKIEEAYVKKELLKNEKSCKKKEIEKELAKVVQKHSQEEIKLSENYVKKEDYFTIMGNQLRLFIDKKGMTFLRPVLDSMKKMQKALEKKESGYEAIPKTLYIYLDELQTILNSWMELNDEQKQLYTEDIKSIAKELTKNINAVTERVHKSQTKNLEVSIAVLLKELKKLTEYEKTLETMAGKTMTR